MSEKQYALYSARKGKLNVIVYEKGPKVLIQGKETEEFIQFILEPEILGEALLGYEEERDPEMFEPHFGIDESGKGDYFGPLVVAGVYTDKDVTRKLMNAEVMDSKRISSAKRINELSENILKTSGLYASVVVLSPSKYNDLYEKFGNLNKLLAWGHASVIEDLHKQVPSCQRALSDQFAKSYVLENALKKTVVNIQLDQRTKGESDIAVAAASIIARQRFVRWIAEASRKGDVEMPLGAGQAVQESARQIVQQHGGEILRKIAKLHFKTTSQVLE